MASEKKTQLSIVLKAVDNATAAVKRINDRLDAATKPIRNFREQLGKLKEKSGLEDIAGGFKSVGSAIGDLVGKVALIGGVVGVAVAGVFKLIDEFDDLGDTAERVGVSVQFLSAMRYAAEKAGAPVEALDSGLQTFNENIGKLKANTGKLATFLAGPKGVSPALMRQVKAAKSNEEAFDLMANAIAKLPDSARRAALTKAAFGGSELAPLLAKGGKGVKALRDRFAELAPGMGDAAAAAGETDDALKDLKAATTGVKAAIVTGLAPALTEIVTQLTAWFQGHREDIKEWAASIGKKLPGAFNSLVGAVRSAIDFLEPFFNSATKIKIAIVAMVAVMMGPLISAIVSLGIALATNPLGLILTAIAALAVAWVLVITHWDEAKAYFARFWNWLDSKIGVVKDIIAVGLAPFIYIPAKIIQYWGPIRDFFVGLWDAVTGAFRAAWDFIKGIVEKITGAVDKVSGAIDTVKAKIGLGPKLLPGIVDKARDAAGLGPQAAAAAALTGAAPQNAQITVDFRNAPPGTKATTAPGSTADVDLGMGYQMSFVP